MMHSGIGAGPRLCQTNDSIFNHQHKVILNSSWYTKQYRTGTRRHDTVPDCAFHASQHRLRPAVPHVTLLLIRSSSTGRLVTCALLLGWCWSATNDPLGSSGDGRSRVGRRRGRASYTVSSDGLVEHRVDLANGLLRNALADRRHLGDNGVAQAGSARLLRLQLVANLAGDAKHVKHRLLGNQSRDGLVGGVSQARG